MLATSRVNRTRLPLAEMSMFSLMLAPLNSSVSVPAWPSTMSLPSPGFQTKVSSPAPRRPTSLPRPPLTRSLPALPMMVSLPSPPLIVEADRLSGLERRGVDRVVAARPLTVSVSSPASACAIVTCAARPLTTIDPPAAATVMLSSPAVPLTMTVSACAVAAGRAGRRPRSIATCVTPVPVRSLTVMLSAPPRASSCDVLDAVEVHGDVADVAGEPRRGRRWPRCRCSRLMLAPLNTSVSLPPWPSTVSLPSPGFHMNVSSPAPRRRRRCRGRR